VIRPLLAGVLLLAFGCGTEGREAPPRDSSRPPRRIVSLIPSVSLTIQALGAGDLLVGRTDYDSAASLAHLPSVGGGIHPNLEALVALEPDLVIRFRGESDPATASRLDALGIHHLALRPDGIADVRETIRVLGEVTRREGAADSILTELDRTLDEIDRRVEGRPEVRVAYLLGGSPPWAAGPDTYIGELLEVAGGVNVFEDMGSLYGPVSPEALLAREIDLILTPEGGELDLPSQGLLPLVRRVSPELEIPGPGLSRSARELASLIHPEAFR
jgi:iron complex transport system substrate-binding protein